MKQNQYLKTLREELEELSNERLRIIKMLYATARGGSHEHQIFTEADRLLLQREGVMH